MVHRWWLTTWNLNKYHAKIRWWTPTTRRLIWNTRGRANLVPWVFLLGMLVVPFILAVVVQMLRLL